MANATTRLPATPRSVEGSRSNRRLRRSGRVPAVRYGGEGEPQHFSVDARDLRVALLAAGAVIELDLDGQSATAVVKEQQRDPVRGDAWHVDFVRVRMDVAIQTTVLLELEGSEKSPGIIEGGVLEQQLRELSIEALPGDVPESITHDVSGLEVGGVLTVADLAAPQGITILDDPETVIASITLPRAAIEAEDAVETETAVVGEADAGSTGGDADEAEPAPDTTSE